MNELFEFRYRINIKKVIGIAGLALVIIIIFIISFFNENESPSKKEDDSNPYKTYLSNDKNISFELPKRYNLQEVESNYALQLKSPDGLLINIEEKPIVFGKPLNEIAESDKNVYIKKFDNIFDVSELQIFTIDNSNLLTSYRYDFKHIVGAIEYDVQIFWIQGNTRLLCN